MGTEKVVAFPQHLGYASSEQVPATIREMLAREPAWAAACRADLMVSHQRAWALMKANGLFFVCERDPAEVTRRHVVAPEPTRRWATNLTTVYTKRGGKSEALHRGARSRGLLPSATRTFRKLIAIGEPFPVHTT